LCVQGRGEREREREERDSVGRRPEQTPYQGRSHNGRTSEGGAPLFEPYSRHTNLPPPLGLTALPSTLFHAPPITISASSVCCHYRYIDRPRIDRPSPDTSERVRVLPVKVDQRSSDHATLWPPSHYADRQQMPICEKVYTVQCNRFRSVRWCTHHIAKEPISASRVDG
jgi:hypothetical protein